MRWLSIIVTFYTLLALVWWSILLVKYADYNRSLRIELLDWKSAEATANLEREKIQIEFERKKRMIVGEALVFGVSVLIGIYLLQKAYRKEIELSRKQNNFLLSVTHELKTPLTSIRMALETLRRNNLPADTKNEVIDAALQDDQRLEDLIESLLMTSRLQEGYHFQFERVPAESFIKESLKGLPPGRATFSNKSADGSEQQLLIDRSAMQLALSNLYANAEKYAPDSEIAVTYSSLDGKGLITVSDFGPGVPDKEKKHVFEKFYRPGDEEKRKTKGTGLGLYIVRQIIEAHDGRIIIKDNKPTGCIFEISLPLKA